MTIQSDKSQINTNLELNLPVEQGLRATIREYGKRLGLLLLIHIIGVGILGISWFIVAEPDIALFIIISLFGLFITRLFITTINISFFGRKDRKSKLPLFSMPYSDENIMIFSFTMDLLATLVAPVFLLMTNTYTGNVSRLLLLGAMLVSELATMYFTRTYVPRYQSNLIFEITSTSLKLALSSLSLIILLIVIGTPANVVFIITFVVTGISLFTHNIWRILFYLLTYYTTIRNLRPPLQILIVGASESGRLIANLIGSLPHRSTQVVGFLDNEVNGIIRDIPVVGTLNDNIFRIIQKYKIDTIILAIPIDENSNYSVIKDIQYAHIPVLIAPSKIELSSEEIPFTSIDQIPFEQVWKPVLNGRARFIKRLTDVLLSTLVLFTVLPTLTLVSLIILLIDGAPIFQIKKQYGENGKIFPAFTFRTLKINPNSKVALISDEGSYSELITHTGRFLRKTSLDELPQLLNIIRGDISFTGPRSTSVTIVANAYQPPDYVRMRVPQGIVGLGQVEQFDSSLAADTYYMKNYSYWLDLKIMILTPLVLLRGKPNKQTQVEKLNE